MSDVSFNNIYKVGCLCQITSYRKNPDGSSKITIRGLNRVKLDSVISDNVRILSNCYIDEDAVIAYGCVIGRFTRIFAGSKICKRFR